MVRTLGILKISWGSVGESIQFPKLGKMEHELHRSAYDR